MHRLYHDFNLLYSGENEDMRSAPLVCRGTQDDIDALGISLQEGMEVLLYEPDVAADGTSDPLEVKAKIRYDAKERCFMADFVWTELMYRSKTTGDKNAKPS